MTRRVAFVTGATSGIGLSVAESLGAAGHAVFVVARDAENLASTVKQLREEGYEADGTTCDVKSTEDIRKAVTKAVEVFGRIEILVNNAGRGGGGEIATLDEDIWTDVIDTNLHSVFRVTKEVR